MTPKQIRALAWCVELIGYAVEHHDEIYFHTTRDDEVQKIKNARAALIRARKECNERKRCKECGATILQKASLPECMKS